MDDLDLTAWAAGITLPDDAARQAALARQAHLTKPAGALGRLEEASAWLAAVSGQCPPPPVAHPALAIFAGDHGVARTARTSAYPSEVTAQMVANFVTGGAAATVLARSRGVTVRVVDVAVDVDWPSSGLPVPEEVTAGRIRRGSGSIDREDAMTRRESEAALRLGARVADELVDAGADLLIPGDMGIGNTTPAAVLVGLLADVDPAAVVGRGTGIDDLTWMRKAAAVRDAMRRGRGLKADPVGLLACCAGPDLAATTGFLLQAAVRRTPVLLDGVVSLAAALVAHRVAFRASAWWCASHRSTEPAAEAALRRLGLEPLLDLGMRLGEGSGALVALPVLTAAGDLLREMATFEDAGVSDRGAEPADAPTPTPAGAAPGHP
ncbi:MAG: nicotinate-nucleotide--dimethylbenzimidazole phosphoribosyltransferase [Candidatus Nanopelagicales bacterium]|nr:nicotinate-nucleotide--dimethylbenzimidazole phosphoribosyltransferase [Candidatus Nanopelagicales bacterium]